MLIKNNNDILVVEDSTEDRHLCLMAFKNLQVKNKIVFACNGKDALSYLRNTEKNPFLIISDLNMPGMDGMELLKAIQGDKVLKRKSAPFIFLTTSDAENEVVQAYENNSQGYFKKPYTVEALEKILKLTMDYWENAKVPNRPFM